MDYLVHYGVKGMKWGVRKDRDEPKKRSLKDYAYVEAYRDENDKVRFRFTSDGPKPLKIPPKKNPPDREGKPKKIVSNHLKFDASKLAAKPEAKKLTSAQKRTSEEAEKDAKEFARAKMYYGEGAGNRRKLIKNQVEAKKKKDPFYAEEFERHLANQDMNEHAIEARRERRRNDNAKANKRALKEAGKLLSRYGGNLL